MGSVQTATDIVLEAPQSRAQSAARVVSSFPFLISSLLVAKMVWGCGSRIGEPDIWWHLGNAKYILANHKFPAVDTTCFTTAGSPAWINNQWLSELIYYAGFHGFGVLGIYLVAVIGYSALWVSVFWLCMKRTGDPLTAAVLTEVGSVIGAVGIGPRTQVFGYLCFIALFAIMLRFRSERRAPLWILPALFCLWINLHGTWFIGLLVYCIFIGAGLIKQDIGQLEANPWSRAELKRLVTTGLLCVAAIFVNPFGYKLVWYPFFVMFKLPIMAAHVEEFASVNFHDELGKFVFLLLIGIFLAAFVGRKKWQIGDALLTAFALYAGLTHMRFLLMAGIILPPLLAPQVGRITTYDPDHERRTLNLGLLVLVLAFIVGFIPSNKKLAKQLEQWFPTQAVSFLNEHPQQGRMFNLDAWGGYLQWNMPQVQTFTDTRADYFAAKGTLKDYLDITLLTGSPQNLLDKYQISYVLYTAGGPLDYYLANSPQWERIYSDKRAVVYRRSSSQQARFSTIEALQK